MSEFTGGSLSSFCQMAVDGGFESTSHFSDTGIPSRRGYPKPGVLVIANDGVSGRIFNYELKVDLKEF